MSLRDQIHEMVDKADDVILARLARELSLDEEETPEKPKDVAKAISLWKNLRSL